MKYAAISLACLLGLAYAQETPPDGKKPADEGKPAEGEQPAAEEEEPPSKAPSGPVVATDPKKLIGELILANASKEVTKIDLLAKEALAWAKGAKDEATVEMMAKELTESLRVAKGNWGTLNTIVEALGELRSKEGAKALKRYAFKKDAKDEAEEKFQATAIKALGKLADTKEIGAFEEASKSGSKLIAKAAYEALGSYGAAKGKVRRQCAEVLMKRIELEYPSSGGQGGKNVSAEKQERWGEVAPVIVASMKALTREATINDIDNWREWWKENKKSNKPWKDDEESEKES